MAGALYYDADDILAEETLIPCSFLKGAKGLGKVFDNNSNSIDLMKGAKIEAPLWLGSALGKRTMAELRLPNFYGPKMQRKMDAGAAVEDLRARCPHFYDVAAKLNNISANPQLAKFTKSCFRARYKALLTRAHSTSDQDNVALISLFSQEELELFEAGRQAMLHFDSWRKTGSSIVHKNINPLKRKSSTALVVASDSNLAKR